MGKFDEFINRLHQDTGLDIGVITAWVQREQGVNNNVLGVTSSSLKSSSNPAGLMKFVSQTQAADYTAILLKTSSQYKGIINSASGTPQQQALAIAQSPWHLGPTGLRNAGGTDPYYYNGFVAAGILSGNKSTDYWNGRATGGNTQTGGLNVSLPDLNPVDAATNAVSGIGQALATPVYFIGIVLIGITLMLIGGLITLKPSIEKAAPMAAMAA